MTNTDQKESFSVPLQRLAIIVIGCESYSDLWDGFFKLLRKNFDLGNENVYLLTDAPTNRKIANVKIITCEQNDGFISNFAEISKIDADYFFVILGDFYIIKPINTDDITHAIKTLDENDGVYFSFGKHRKTKGILNNNKQIKLLNPRDVYSIRLEPSLWKKELIESVLANTPKTLNIWQFEPRIYSFIDESLTKKLYLSSSESIIDYMDIVRKGKLVRKAQAMLKNENIVIDRPVMTKKETTRLKLTLILRRLLPKRIQKIIKNRMRKKGTKFHTDL